MSLGLIVHALVLSGCAVERGSRHLLVVVDHPAMSPWSAQGFEEGNRVEWISEGPVFVPRLVSEECVPSWNIDVAEGWSCAIDVRAQVGSSSSDALADAPSEAASRSREEWSPWMPIGSWGVDEQADTLKLSELPANPGNGVSVDVDTIVTGKAHRGMLAVQLRVRAWSSDARGRDERGAAETLGVPRVSVRRLALCFSPAPTPQDARLATDHSSSCLTAATGQIRLDVPFRSQRTTDPALAGRLCSPTSVTMALAYFGQHDLSVESVARRVYDTQRDIYGNWSRTIQGAYALGAPGYIRRFNSWPEVARVLREGTPIIASITAYKGELLGAPYEQSGGHLIVITGLDGRGGVYVNDPAASSAETGRLVYRQRDLDRVWLARKKGTAYILEASTRPAPASPKDPSR